MYDFLFRNVLTHVDPERAHHMSMSTLKALDTAGFGSYLGEMYGTAPDPVNVLGLQFPNRVGLAAGFDKNGSAIRALSRLGFGHIEVGTITAHSQPGNPKPRLFRLTDHHAILNRMGFNNDGARQAVFNIKSELKKLRVLPESRRPIVGINIGKTKVVPADDAVSDYATSARLLSPLADYLVINVSSPNTPGLRDLQAIDTLRPIVDAVRDEADTAVRNPRSTLGHVPLLVKIAPDLNDRDILEVTDMCIDAGVDGLICTNTTINRDVLSGKDKELAQSQAGGISGRPVADRSVEVLRLIRAHTDALTLVSVGGIETAAHAHERLAAGASLVQGYTGMIYRGPGWASQITKGIRHA
ncbi:dihydroorotate dehydrogenase (quinone) [Brevibacterium paucivorans]|uniref:Dihydroorotate dehydrogenase (quinone) n=2 Tax=Brevibacterium paucivorans TaxID=170994 RepID=A0A2N6VQ83_9MICO|nr:dihydroorotate dehydrogenase (quinone) [Brevibacterium paucivorans]